jgi:rare lipoprotein A
VALAVPQSAPTPAPTPVAVATVAVPPVVAAAPFRSGTTFVQVAALSDQGRAAWLSGYLKPFGSTVIERASAGLWRVRLGPYQSRAEATLILAQVQAAGYTAAQIVAASMTTPASTTPAR